MNLKNGIEKLTKESKKPLHIRSLENQIAHNSDYKAIADLLSGNDENLNDAYFYGFKDAYERSGYNPSEDQLRDELMNAYWQFSDNFKDSYGGGSWAENMFYDKYGSQEDFIKKGIEAHNKHFGR